MFISWGPYILRAWHSLPWKRLNDECREKNFKKKWYAAGANQAMISTLSPFYTDNLKSGLNLKLLSCLWPAFQAFFAAMFAFKKRSRSSYLYSPQFSSVMKLMTAAAYDHKHAAFTHSKNSSASQFRQRLALYTKRSFPCSTDETSLLKWGQMQTLFRAFARKHYATVGIHP